MPRIFATSLTLLTLTFLTACGGGSDHDGHAHDEAGHSAFAEVSKAICVLTPTTGTELKDVRGTITFTRTKTGVLVEANVTGLKPNSKHGFHVHQWGDTSDLESGKATGGHYDPTGSAEHGLPGGHSHGDEKHYMTGGHAGDFGNLESDENGTATYSKTYEDISLTDNNAVLGRAIIVHIKEDDGGQPTGNAGARVAQGVIGIANPE
ncbi:MAG: superoxide dismutase family protein [Phycisphaeraceae bacterium]